MCLCGCTTLQFPNSHSKPSRQITLAMCGVQFPRRPQALLQPKPQQMCLVWVRACVRECVSVCVRACMRACVPACLCVRLYMRARIGACLCHAMPCHACVGECVLAGVHSPCSTELSTLCLNSHLVLRSCSDQLCSPMVVTLLAGCPGSSQRLCFLVCLAAPPYISQTAIPNLPEFSAALRPSCSLKPLLNCKSPCIPSPP